jgi:penicillin amidase
MGTMAKLGATVVLAILATLGGLGWWLSGSQPRNEGNLRLPGLRATVTVARDDAGVPRIIAESDHDAYFALGFVHAQDRLWQMEIQRRLGAGRLAEILGAPASATDTFMRTLGLYRLAERDFEGLSPDVKSGLEAYSAGVNAYINAHSGPLPPEFVLLRHRPEPWTPADSVVWGKLMAMQLAGNWRDELLRARLQASLPAEQIADLWPDYPRGQPVTIGLSEPFLDHMLAAIPSAVLPHLASNVWVVSGERSQTGKPILANDPHLGFQAPILWYLATVSTPDLEVSGGTVPGTPFHLLGHNRRIAWGLTTTQSDTMDLFIEKAEGDGYSTPEGPQPFHTRSEIIKVRGADAVVINVRETRHGPVISDVLGEKADGQILALSAAAFQPDDRTIQAVYKINRAGNWDEFQAALQDFHAPQQNVAYADVDGHIGLTSPGRIPIRKSGDGTLPRPGWTGEFDWVGWVPFDALPRVFDPPSGVIVNANNKIVGDNYPYLLAANWPEGYRAQRILERLDERPRHSIEDMSALQMDNLSLMAVELKPLLLKQPPNGGRAKLVYDLLKAWDGTADPRAAEPLIFQAWLRQLQQDLLAPSLGPYGETFAILHPRFLKAVLQGHTQWCVGLNQPAPADCHAVVAHALDTALDRLTRRFGDNIGDWHWGDAHVARFDALLFSHIPLLAPATRLSLGTGGDDFTIQRGGMGEADPASLTHTHGAGMRAVYDLSDLDASRFVIATGQSGNPLSAHWGDMLELWGQGGSMPLPPRRPPTHVVLLEPPPS